MSKPLRPAQRCVARSRLRWGKVRRRSHARWLPALPLLGIPTINAANFSIGGLLISFVGALILLAIVNLFRRGRAR